ncbi:MAG: Serine phosphatase RsbU, regulator of sigma subunit, partial [uncultured Gemmatimonadaceae bacterium]
MTAPAGPGGGCSILVVDDNELNRDLLSRRLRRMGHAVEAVEDGGRALELLSAAPFDLVMLDIMMPGMNGYEVLARLKADPALCHVPVIMITAVDDEASVVRCIELGAEDYMPKPFNPALLKARVGSSLAKKRLHDREQTYAAGLARELDIGRHIQQGFLPARLPAADGWELTARFAPARQVAGDFYDAFLLPHGRLAVLVADVCDKGVGAALFMALFRSLFRALAEQRFTAAASGDAP